jgi:putative membrane protein
MSVSDLPHLNAALNALSGLLLATGFVFIKSRNIAAHRRCMLAAFVTSSLFLTSYVIYHSQAGSRPFSGTGTLRVVYYSILIPHVILAAAVPPLAIITLKRGLKMDVARHRRIAKITLPIWSFVSVTGVLVYLMLYWMPQVRSVRWVR